MVRGAHIEMPGTSDVGAVCLCAESIVYRQLRDVHWLLAYDASRRCLGADLVAVRHNSLGGGYMGGGISQRKIRRHV